MQQTSNKKNTVKIMIVVFVMTFSCLVGFLGKPQPVYASEEVPVTDQILSAVSSINSAVNPITRVSEAIEKSTGEMKDAIAKFATDAAIDILYAIAWVLSKLVAVLGQLLNIAVDGLKLVASYGDKGEFSAQSEVILGWKIVRDVMNSFFVVVLIAIAIATMIRWQPFHFKQTLPRFILAAILINFSRTICLLVINFSTSIMVFFVNGITNWGALLVGLQVVEPTKLAKGGSITDMATAVAAQMMAIIFVLMALGMIIFYVIILVFRIVTLWLLMILSPLAFFLFGTPGRGQSYWKQWLDEFIKHVMIGPIIGFFLYIIILFVNTSASRNFGFNMPEVKNPAIPTKMVSDPNVFITFIIVMCLMAAALEIAQQLGVRGGAVARNIAVQKYGGLVKSVAGAGRDKLYSSMAGGKIMSKVPLAQYMAPLLKPLRAWDSMKAGLSSRQVKGVQEGDRALAAKGAELRRKGGFVRGAWLSAGSGNKNFWEDFGIAGTVSKSVWSMAKSPYSVIKEQFRPPQKVRDQVEQRDALRSMNKTYKGSGIQKQIGGWNKATFNGAMNIAGAMERAGYTNSDDVEVKGKDQIRLQELQAGLDGLSGSEKTKAEAEITQLRASLTADKQLIDNAGPDARNNANVIADASEEDKGVYKAMGEKLNSEGVGWNKTDTIDKVMENNQMRKGEDADIKKSALAELSKREEDAQVFYGGARADYDSRVNDYRKKTYPIDEEQDPSEIGARALSHAKPGDIYEFTGDIIQATKQGGTDLQDVMAQLGEHAKLDFSMNSEGMSNFYQWLQAKKGSKGMGVSEQEAATLISRIQRENKDAGRISMTALLKRKAGGGSEIVSEHERTKTIKATFDKKDLGSILRKGPDAVAVKVKGEYQLAPGFVEYINGGGQQSLEKALNKFGGEIPKELMRAMHKSVGASGGLNKQVLSPKLISQIEELGGK